MSERGAAQARPAGSIVWWRMPFLVLGFVALAIGIGAGLARLAWPTPDAVAGAAVQHGPLMVCGFFGVVIGLERAVAIGRPWAYSAPLAGALGTAAALPSITLGGAAIAPWLYGIAALMLTAASADVLRRQRQGFNVVITLAAACWLVGTAAWALGAPVHGVVGWWVGFLVLTIAGERLELSRFMPPSALAKGLFAGIVGLLMAGLLGWRWVAGQGIFGAALLLLAAWLLRNDIARRTVQQQKLTRYIAVCLLAGYFWLGLAGAVILAAGLSPGGAAYDAALHVLLLGFVFSMVFGHAPIIFPAVLRVALPYHVAFYAPLALLHAAVAIRVVGAALGLFEMRRWGGLLAAVALLAFIATMVSAVVRGRRRAG